MKQTRMLRCIVSLVVMGCVLTGCGSSNTGHSSTATVPSNSASYVVDENENTITAADNSWTIEVTKNSSSSVITQTYTDAMQELEDASIGAYSILMDSVTSHSDGSKQLERVIAVAEEDVENGLDAALLRAALPEKDGVFYAILGYEYDAAGTLVRTWISDIDETLQYTYDVANGDWSHDSAEAGDAFLDKFHALFTSLDEDLQDFLQEQQSTLEKVAEKAEQLVESVLPNGGGDNAPSQPDPDPDTDKETDTDTVPEPTVLASGSCGDTVTWALTEGGLLTLSGTGKTSDYTYQDPAPWHEYNTQITAVKVESGVTYLGDQLFLSLLTLKDVEIADTVTELGSNVFAHCIALEKIVLPDHITTTGKSVFLGCTSLTDVTLPADLTKLSAYFFGSCTSLARITIPLGITYIDEDAFNGTTALTSVYFYTDDIDNWDAIPGSDCEDLIRNGVVVHYNGCTDE